MSLLTTEYKILLKDLVSGGLAKMGSVGSSAFERLSSSASKAKNSFDKLPSSISGLRKQLDDLTRLREVSVSFRQIRQLDREIDSVQQRLNRLDRPTGGGGLSGMIPGGIGGIAAMAGIGGAGALLNLAGREELAGVSFEVLTGSKKSGANMLGNLKQYAKDTPYGQNELIAGAEMMMGFGVSEKNVMPSIKMLGDVARADKERFKSLTLAYSQVMASGKLQGQDLLQFVNAGFNPLKELSRTTGRSMADLREEMTKGNISALMVANAFKSATSEGGLFHNMTERMSTTFVGRLSTMKDTAMEFGKGIAMTVLPALNTLLATGTKLFEYKEVVIMVGGAWFLYAKGQAMATLATRLFTGSLITMRAALIATGVGAIAVAIGLLWNLYERTKKTTDGFNVLKTGIVSFGQTIKNQFLMMGEAMKYAMERFAMSKGGKVLLGLGQLMVGNFKGGIATIQSIFSGDNEGELEALRTKYEGRIANLRGNQMEAWANTKSSFGKLYGKSASASIGGLDEASIIGSGVPSADLAGVAAKADGITSGGPRSIVVNIGKFQDNVNIYAAALNEGVDEIERKLTEMLLRVTNSVATVN